MSTRLNSTSEQSGRHAPPATAPTGAAQIDIDVVIPVHDEQATLERSIRCLHAFLTTEMRSPWRIVIADNASADATSQIARTLADELVHVTSLRLEEKLSGHAELAIGTRLAPGANVTRGLKRELISRSYNRLVQIALRARFSDAQCGFTAARRDVLDELLAEVRDQGWFFDTELLVAAEHRGLRIHEVPVDWTDDSTRAPRSCQPRSPTCAASPGWSALAAPAHGPWRARGPSGRSPRPARRSPVDEHHHRPPPPAPARGLRPPPRDRPRRCAGRRVGAPRPDRAPGDHRDRLRLGSERLGRRQQLLRRRRTGRNQALEGVLLRLA